MDYARLVRSTILELTPELGREFRMLREFASVLMHIAKQKGIRSVQHLKQYARVILNFINLGFTKQMIYALVAPAMVAFLSLFITNRSALMGAIRVFIYTKGSLKDKSKACYKKLETTGSIKFSKRDMIFMNFVLAIATTLVIVPLGIVKTPKAQQVQEVRKALFTNKVNEYNKSTLSNEKVAALVSKLSPDTSSQRVINSRMRQYVPLEPPKIRQPPLERNLPAVDTGAGVGTYP